MKQEFKMTQQEMDDIIAMGYLNHYVTDALKRIIEQLEKCNYETEAGDLNNNVAFLALKKMSKQ